MDKAKGLLIRSDSIERSPIFSYEEHHSIDTTSIDGLSRSSHDRYDADLASSPIDLICQRQILSNEVSSSDDDERSPLGWPLARQQRSHLKLSPVPNSREELGYFGAPAVVMPSSPRSAESSNVGWSDGRSAAPAVAAKNQTPEIEMMKERFSKLLLGEDMSGSGKGVCTALAISNALTNLAASVFGELWRLEPLSLERKLLWEREMNWILSVCDHIVEFVPSFHSVTDGTSLEVMISRPRSDLHINLPALRKLDAMLLVPTSFVSHRRHWTATRRLIFGMWTKECQSIFHPSTNPCPQSGRRTSGGCRSRKFPGVASRRSPVRRYRISGIARTRSSRQPWRSMSRFFRRCKYPTFTGTPFQRAQEPIWETQYTSA